MRREVETNNTFITTYYNRYEYRDYYVDSNWNHGGFTVPGLQLEQRSGAWPVSLVICPREKSFSQKLQRSPPKSTSQSTTVKQTNVEKSAFGIHFLFIGVSSVIGRRASTELLSGRPLFGSARLLTNCKQQE